MVFLHLSIPCGVLFFAKWHEISIQVFFFALFIFLLLLQIKEIRKLKYFRKRMAAPKNNDNLKNVHLIFWAGKTNKTPRSHLYIYILEKSCRRRKAQEFDRFVANFIEIFHFCCCCHSGCGCFFTVKLLPLAFLPT